VSTNKAFADWSEVFPNAACAVTLVDRLVHKSEILPIDARSYRLKEAREAAAMLQARRRPMRPAPGFRGSSLPAPPFPCPRLVHRLGGFGLGLVPGVGRVGFLLVAASGAAVGEGQEGAEREAEVPHG
jgi:hypothetical protein